MPESSAPRARTRAINVEGGQTTPQHTPEMEALARKAFAANEAKNRATREASKALKELTLLMAQAKRPIKKFSFKVGKDWVDTTYLPGQSESIDVAGLAGEMGLKETLAVCTTSAAKVKDAFGSNILNKYLKKKDTDYKVAVKKRK